MRVALLASTNRFGTGPLEVRQRSVPKGVQYVSPKRRLHRFGLPYNLRVPLFARVLNRFVPHLDSLAWSGGFPSCVHVGGDVDLVHSLFDGHWAFYDGPWIHDSDGTLWGYLTRIRGASPAEIRWTMKIASKILGQNTCRKVVLWTERAANDAILRYQIDPEKVTVVPPAIALHDKEPRRDNDGFTVLYIGTDWRLKGGDIALQAFRELTRLGDLVRLIYVGPLPPRHREGVQQMPEVSWFPSVSHSTIMDNLFPRADAFMLPARVEAFGLSILEAMSFGIPPVISSIPAGGELVTHRVNGLVSENGSVSNLVALLHLLMEDRMLRTRLGAAAQRTVERVYSPTAVGEKLGEVYEECLGN